MRFSTSAVLLEDKNPIVVSPWPFSSMADLQVKLAQAWNWRSRRDLEKRLMGLDVRMRREASRKVKE